MKFFLRYYLKYILLTAVFVAVLLPLGIMNVHRTADIEGEQSSYTRTRFDFFLTAPTQAQVEQIESDSSVDKVFPYYAVNKAFTGNTATEEIFLLFSDDMQDYSISLFSEDTLVEGKYEEGGILLDALAAQKLGVKVGDRVHFSITEPKTFLSHSFEGKVSAIYLTSTYGMLTKGVALMQYTQAISAALHPIAYSAAFLSAKDKEGAATLLKDYVGEGCVTQTYEEYTASFVKPPYQSEEDFEAENREKYEQFRTQQLSAAKSRTQVASKEEGYALLRDRVATTEESVHTIDLLSGIAAFVLFALFNFIFLITNRADDRLRCDEGMRLLSMLGIYALAALAMAVVICALTFGVLHAIAAQTFFLSECMATVLWFSLPVLACVPLVVVIDFLFVRMLYTNSARA